MPEMLIQLELPFDAKRIENVTELHSITLSKDVMRIYINDLLNLADKLFLRDAEGAVNGLADPESLILISRYLVGRVSEMLLTQNRRYRLLMTHLEQFYPTTKAT